MNALERGAPTKESTRKINKDSSYLSNIQISLVSSLSRGQEIERYIENNKVEMDMINLEGKSITVEDKHPDHLDIYV